MGKKSKAKKATGPSAETEQGAAEEQHEPSELEIQIATLLDQLRPDEATAALDEAKELPEHIRKALREEAVEMARFFTAPGVRAEVVARGADAGGDGRGRGLLTTKAFNQGDVLLEELPLLVAPRKLCTVGAAKQPVQLQTGVVQEAYDALTAVQRRLLRDFRADMEHMAPELAAAVASDSGLEQLARFARVMRINAHEHPEAGKAGLYVLTARANHSCNPSCGLASGPGGRLMFYALRDMQAGEEVDYSYLGGHFTLHPTAVRREQLLQAKLFECQCVRCLAPESFEGPTDCDEEKAANIKRLALALSKKVEALESAWNDPAKDVTKYILDWEGMAERCRTMLGIRHHLYGRSCFFALQALNTGKIAGVGGVDDERYAKGMSLYALPLVRYLKECCPLGVRRASLEPVGRALQQLALQKKHAMLACAVVDEAGIEDLLTCFFDDSKTNKAFRKFLETAKSKDKAESAGGAD
eukprot:gnl/TRDRNA2_/TRDRNA2_87094_c0_seq1.p1 gnl/TRDRNA2_/TRDRNA2_87094_c0~~gnl/TRDRNA2_/TRDRNA2_87094_c0_seq1.p1  ORF type:complete len:472 (-),score=110.16 gnl/TRDRNA2_/TRDRNA2_87094_c0_seq1:83-1498(-)